MVFSGYNLEFSRLKTPKSVEFRLDFAPVSLVFLGIKWVLADTFNIQENFGKD